MPARLTLFLADRPARVYTLREGGEHVVGRDPDCAVRIDDDRASRRHAMLRAGRGGWRLADLQSKNGTQVDGTAVRATGAPLLETSWISFGGVLARFEQLSEEEASRQQEEQLRRWQSSVEMQRQLTPSLGLPALLDKLLGSVLQLSRTDRAFVLLAEPDGSLVLAASRGMPAGTVTSEEFAGSVGAVQLALRESRAVATSDAQLDSRLAHRASVAEQKIRALVCLPLTAADRLVGALYADSSRAGAELTELDVDILTGLASHAALGITVARLDAELARVAAGLSGAAPTSAPRARGAAAAPRDPVRERPGTTVSVPADDTGLRWDELVTAHRGRQGAVR
ncbi:MAG TPA: FHA domain-containing protein [Thermoanaerobaculia bacterium]|nr:FHA domain-containing protein [Thermoanaerobaculia bacterium]HXT51736.1 FHA domain-containing protein [Thermoanaerobaculia bacterium]